MKNYSWLRDPCWPEVKDPAIKAVIEKPNINANLLFEGKDLERISNWFQQNDSKTYKTEKIRNGSYYYYEFMIEN